MKLKYLLFVLIIATNVFAQSEPTVLGEHSLYFDGDYDYVDLPYNMINTGTSFTVEAWVKPESFGNYIAFFNGSGVEVNLGLSVTHIFGVLIDSGEWGDWKIIGSNQNYELNKWIHYAGIYDFENNKIQIFLNGYFQMEMELNDNTLKESQAISRLGYYSHIDTENLSHDFFHGKMDEVRISNNVRYNQDFIPSTNLVTDENTIALWKFNSGNGNLLVDASGNENNGIIVDAQWSDDVPNDWEPAIFENITSFDQGKELEWQISHEITEKNYLNMKTIGENVKFGNGALQIDYSTQSLFDWGGLVQINHFNQNPRASYDFSQYNVISFWYNNITPASEPNKMQMRINLLEGGEQIGETFNINECEPFNSYYNILDDEPGWKYVEIPLSNFDNPGWWGSLGNNRLDLEYIRGITIQFSMNNDRVSTEFVSGQIILDELKLKYVEPTILTIAEARKDENGDFVPDLLNETVSIKGIITSPNLFEVASYFIQDETAALRLNGSVPLGLSVGDEVLVNRGTVKQFRGVTRVNVDALENIEVLSQNNPLPEPKLITINDLGEAYESQLVRINNLYLSDPSAWPNEDKRNRVDGIDIKNEDNSATTSYNITMMLDYTNWNPPYGKFDIICNVSQSAAGEDLDDHYLLFGRSKNDFIISLFEQNANVIPLLNNLLNDNNKVNKSIETAINNIQQSLDPKLWADEYHPDEKKGSKVFEENKSAVHELMKILKEKNTTDSYKSSTTKNIKQIVAIQKEIVDYIYNEVSENCNSDKCKKEIDKAIKELTKAEDEFEKVEFDRTIEHYKKAWQHLQVAINKTESIAKKNGYNDSPNVEVQIPDEYYLQQNYPNPFNPTTTISYALKEQSKVRLSIYNLLGEEIILLVDQIQSGGTYNISFDASNLTSGIYLYKIVANNYVATKKMTLIK